MQQISKGKAKKGSRTSSKAEDASGRFSDSTWQSEKTNGVASPGPLQSSEREKHIAIIAYYKAEQRGFQGQHQLDDWLAAEREFDGAYLARTIGSQGDEP